MHLTRKKCREMLRLESLLIGSVTDDFSCQIKDYCCVAFLNFLFLELFFKLMRTRQVYLFLNFKLEFYEIYF